MKREHFDIAAGLVERISKLEEKIFLLKEIMNKKSYVILASDEERIDQPEDFSKKILRLNANEMATEVFIQDVLEYYFNTLNLELNELRKSFEEL